MNNGYLVHFIKVRGEYYPWTDFELYHANKFIDKKYKDLIFVGQGNVFNTIPENELDSVVWPCNYFQVNSKNARK